MPSRISCMYPGSSGASRNLNMMSEGNGNNKWQGLPGLTNLRSSLVVPVTTRAYGTNRDKVFCINQLGGVGRFSNMFASVADGVKLPCQGSGSNKGIRTILGSNVTTFNETFGNSPFTFDDTNLSVNEIQTKLYNSYQSLKSYTSVLDEISNNSAAKLVGIVLTELSSPSISLGSDIWSSDFNSLNSPTSTNNIMYTLYLNSSGWDAHPERNNDGFWSPNQNTTSPTNGSEVGINFISIDEIQDIANDGGGKVTWI